MIFFSSRLRGWVNDSSGKPRSFIEPGRISIRFLAESGCKGLRRCNAFALRRRILAAIFISFLLPAPTFANIVSNRIADYSIGVQLNPRTNSIDGHEVIVWHNTTSQSAGSLYFHLYPNAFRRDNATFITENRQSISPSARGWIDITSFTDLRTNSDLSDQIRYVGPGNGNPRDSTVMMVQLPSPVGPGDSITVSIDFVEQLPQSIACGGWSPGSRSYLVTRWFPQIGVFQKGAWYCHRFHALGGSFVDFGVFDVKITVPAGYKVGATGENIGKSAGSNGSVIYHYVAYDVQGFAWTASPDFVSIARKFKYPGLPETQIVLLLQPDHRSRADSYFSAVDSAMKYFGLWYGPYPYPVLTLVDLPRTMAVDGSNLECPTLISVRAPDYTLGGNPSLETAIIREFGYQYWSGLVANSGFQNSWLDEGLDSYLADKILEKAYGPGFSVFKIGGTYPVYMYPIATIFGVPIAAIIGKVRVRDPYDKLPLFLQHAETNAISDYDRQSSDRGASRAIACDKPDLVLWTLEGVLGRDTMAAVLKTYFNQFEFRHPTPEDFEKVCEQVSGKNLEWFFKQFVDGTGTVDFAVKSISYYRETDLGTGASNYFTTVIVARNGEVKMPVDVRLALDDGTAVDTLWNGESRWQSFSFKTTAPPDYAVVDPAGKIPLDTNYSNNSLRVHSFFLPVLKWGGRIFNYFQNMLLIMGTLV